MGYGNTSPTVPMFWFHAAHFNNIHNSIEVISCHCRNPFKKFCLIISHFHIVVNTKFTLSWFVLSLPMDKINYMTAKPSMNGVSYIKPVRVVKDMLVQ